ncbi:MAG: transposase family protein [Planctomycetota bacterium]
MIVIVVSSSSPFGICPHCQRISYRVHSFYQRQPTDLPFADHPVRLMITVRRFFSDKAPTLCFGRQPGL